MKLQSTLMVLVTLVAAAVGQTAGTAAQTQVPPPPTTIPAANPADVKSMESIVAALYDVISGPAGQKRDWNRFRSLFMPGARLIPMSRRLEGDYAGRVLTPEDYIARTEPFFAKESFYEKEVARRVEHWSHIAQVFSTYESRHAQKETPFMRGINSIQLMNDGQRWWIVTVLWEQESRDNPLPAEMLHSPGR